MSKKDSQQGMSFAAGIDVTDLIQGKDKIVGAFEEIGKSAQEQGVKVEAAMKKIGLAVASYFSIQALTQFAQSVVHVRGEIESLEISFETLLGSKTKADELFSAIREFAVTTPMTMNSLASGAQTLLGFGIEAEKVMPILKQIGDISMGNADKFNSLTLAFAQASSAGKLAGQDFLQMVNAGFNPLNEMSKTTGKSIKQLKEDMENGLITTKELEGAFAAATAEGGMFHGMLEKQSHGIQGALSNLEGAWDDMLNKIGESQQETFVEGVNALTALINNYEVFLNAILSIVAAYGAYKGALMAVWTIEKARALADNIRLIMMMRKELGLLTAAQQAFNLKAMANPYVLLASAIIGVCTALYLYFDTATDAEKAQKAVNDERDRFVEGQENERNEVQNAINIIRDKTQTDFDQVKAYRALQKVCPEITDAYSREALAVADLNEVMAILNEKQEQQNYDQCVNELAKYKNALEEVKAAGGDWKKLTPEADKVVRTVHSWGLLKNAEPILENLVDTYQTKLDAMEEIRRQAEEEAKPLNVRIEQQTTIVSDLEDKLNDARDELDAAQKQFEANPTMWNKWIEIQAHIKWTNLQEALNQANNTLTTLQAQTPQTYQSAFTDARKAYNDARTKVANMKKNKGAYSVVDWTNANEELEKTKKAYQTLGGEVSTQTKKHGQNHQNQVKKLLEDIKEIRAKYQLQINEAQLKLMDEGMKKRLAAIELERQQTIAAIDKEEQDLIKKLAQVKQKETQADIDQFNSRRTAANQSAAMQVRKTEEENARYIADLYRAASEVFLTEEQRKVAQVRHTYAENRKTLEDDLKGGTITQEQYNELLALNNKAEAKEIEDTWLGMYGDYYQKRKQLQETWESNLAAMPAEYQAEARRQMAEQLGQMDSERFKKSIDWDSVLGDLGTQSVQSLQLNLERVRKFFEANKSSMGVEEIKEYQEAITKMETEIASRNPFAALHKSITDIGKAKEAYVNAVKALAEPQKEYTAAQEEYNAAYAEQQRLLEEGKTNAAILKSEEFAKANERLTTATNDLSRAEEKKNKAENNVVKAQNQITKSYKNLAAQLKNVGGVINDIGGKAKNLAAVFSDNVADGIGKALDFMDEVFDATQSVINAIGDVAKGVAKGVEGTVDATASATKATAAAGAASLSTMEKASVILTIISAALQVATAIANLFNNDDKKQKEIERLQERIDQLQWELDNAETVRLQERTGNAVERVRNIMADTLQLMYRLNAAEINHGNLWQRFAAIRKTEMQAYQKSIERLADAYAKLDYTADKALGGDKFADGRKQLENYAEQQMLIQKQINEEQSKKKTDSGKIADWERDIQEIAQKMATVINDMLEEIIGGSAEDIATQLGEAFIDAAKQGEDAMDAWHAKVKEIVADVTKRMLITKFLEEPLGNIFNQYKKRWFGDDGKFKGIDNVVNSMADFSNDLNQVGETFSGIWQSLPDDVKDWFDDAEREGAQRGIATASQDSVDENNARLTTIQGHTYTLVQGMQELNSTSNQILMRVTGIERNTGDTNTKLDAMATRLRRIEDEVSDINTKGIKLKS